MAYKAEEIWDTGICGCFENASTCCYGFWCCPCLACSVSRGFGENSCLPLCDILTLGIMAACEIPLVVPPAVLSLRSAMRNRYDIKGSLCNDILVSCCCVWCAWCQMHRELKVRKTPAVTVNVQTNVVNMQPMMQPMPMMMQPMPMMMQAAPVYQAQPTVIIAPTK